MPKGTYTLFVDISNPDQWDLIVNKKTGEWGLAYDKSAGPWPREDEDEQTARDG